MDSYRIVNLEDKKSYDLCQCLYTRPDTQSVHDLQFTASESIGPRDSNCSFCAGTGGTLGYLERSGGSGVP